MMTNNLKKQQLPPFSIRLAIERQVQKEDLLRWAHTPEERPKLAVRDEPKPIRIIRILSALIP